MASDFDGLPDQAPEAQAPETDFSGLPDQTLPEDSVKQSMYLSQGKDPDRQSKVIQMAKEMDTDPDFVDRNYDDLLKTKEVEGHDYADMVARNPGLSKWLADPNNSAVAKDDLDNLKKIETQVAEHGFMSRAYDGFFNYGLSKMYSRIAQTPAFLYEAAAIPQNLVNRAMGREQISAPSWLRNNPAVKHYEEIAGATVPKEMDQQVTKLFAEGNYGEMGKTLAIQFLANMPQQALTLTGYASGLKALSLAQAGMATAAESATEAAKNRETNPDAPDVLTSTLGAVAKGTAESAFESVGTFGILKSWENVIAKQAGKEVSKKVMGDFVKTVMYSMAAEGTEEASTSVFQDLTDYITGDNPEALDNIGTNALESLIAGSFSGVLLQSPGGAMAGHRRLQQARKAQLATDFYKSLGKSAEATKLRERMPEAQKSYMESILKGGDVENIFIPVAAFEQYFQGGKDAATVLGEMGIAHEYDKAKETGADVQIPLAAWVDKTVGTPHFYELQNDIRFHENDATVNEIKQEREEMKAVADAAAAEETTRQQEFETQGKEIQENAVKQMLETGKYNQDDANQIGSLLGQIFKTAASRKDGATPQQIFDQYQLKIAQGQAPKDAAQDVQTFNQSANRKDDLGFYSQVESEVSKMDFKQMPAKDLANRIKNIQGIKAEELELLGINEWLATQDGKVSKDDVLNFIKQNGLQVEQVVLGDLPKKVPLKKDDKTQWGDDPEFSASEYVEPDDSYLSDLVGDNVYERVREAEKGEDDHFTKLLKKAIDDAQENVDLENSRIIDLARKKAEKAGKEFDEDDVDLDVVDEEEIKKETLESYQESLEESEYEYARSEDAGYGEYKIEEKVSGETMTGGMRDRGQEWSWTDPDGKVHEYGYDEEEAKIQWQADLFEHELIQPPVDIPGPSDINFEKGDVYLNEQDIEIESDKIKASAAYQEYIKKLTDEINAQHKKMDDERVASGDKPGKPEIYAHTLKRRVDNASERYISDAIAESLALNDKRATFEYKVTNEAIESHDPNFEGILKGNETTGWEFKVTYFDTSDESQHPRRTDTVDIPAETTLDDAKKKIMQKLGEIGYLLGAPEAPAVPQIAGPEKTPEQLRIEELNKPTEKSKWKSHSVYGRKEGANYREILLTLPKIGPDKFTYNTHFPAENFVAHARLSDVTTDGKKVLFIEEIQSDWHQKGREHGYKGDNKELQEEIKRADFMVNDLSKERDLLQNRPVTDADVTLVEQDSDKEWHVFFGTDVGEEEHSIVAKDEAEARQIAVKKVNEDRRGTVDTNKQKENSVRIKELDDLIELFADKGHELKKQETDSPPDAPFKQTEAWTGLVMKRLIRMAAEQGYDKVAWSPASVHVERWGTDNVSWVKVGPSSEKFSVAKNTNGSWAVNNKHGNNVKTFNDSVSDTANMNAANEYLKILNKPHWLVGSAEQRGGNADGINIEELARARGELLERNGERVATQDDLKNVIASTLGREKTDRSLVSLTERIWKQMQTEDHHTGAVSPRREGMEFFYNKMIPDVTKKLLSKIDKDNKIKVLEMPMAGQPGFDGEALSFDITDKLKEKVMTEGFSLFQSGPDDARGSITFDKNKHAMIQLFEKSDMSTLLHELGHLQLEIMGDLAQAEGANQDVKDDYAGLLKWLGVESRDQIKTVHHEQFARGFEAYLMEGKAPTQGLRRAFARFKSWIISTYKHARKLNVNINDDIRGIFDRMIATEQEIADARGELGFEEFKDPSKFGITGKAGERFAEANERAIQAAEEQLQAKLIASWERQKTAEYKARFKTVAAEVEEQANEMNIYKLVSALQKNLRPDGSPLPEGMPTQIKIDRQSVINEYGKDFAKKLPRGILSNIKDGGFHHSQLAEMFGFESGDDLLVQLANLEPKKDYIERVANERIKTEYPDLYETGDMHEESLAVIHNDQMAQVMRMALEHMAANDLPAVKDAIKKMTRRMPTEKEVRETATRIIAGKKISDIRPHLFIRAEVRSVKESGILFTKGDFVGSFEAMRRALLNHELYRASILAQETMEKAETRFKKLNRSDEKIAKTRDLNYVNAARAILASYGIGETDESPLDYIKKIQEYAEPDVYQSVAALIDAATVRPTGKFTRNVEFKDLTYDNFVSVMDSVDALWALAKSSKEIEIDGQREDKYEAIDLLTARLGELSKPGEREGYDRDRTNNGNFSLKLLGARSALRRVESWVDSMDGSFGKVFRKYIWNPVKEAETRYKINKLPVLKKFFELVDPIRTSLTTKEIVAHELNGYKFKGKATVLGAMLHRGNLSNHSKLLRGRGWGTTDENGVLDTSRWDRFEKRMRDEGVLTKQDYEMLQGIWDLMDSLKPDAQKAHFKMYGYHFNEVTANEFTNEFGTFRGGYVPAKVDPNMAEASARQDKENLEKNGNSFAWPTTGRGATKSRVEQYAAPLLMDLNLIAGHIDWAMRFIHIEPALKDVAKIVMDKKFQASLSLFDETASQDMLVPWLQRVGQQKVTIPSQGQAGKLIDTVSKFLRRNTGMSIMFGNVLNTVQQLTGFSVSALKVKPRYLKSALWNYVRSPLKTAEMVQEKSDFMKTRSGNQLLDVQKDIDDLLLNPSKYEKFQDFAQANAYILQSVTQGTVDNVVWSGAYDQAIESGETEKEAVRAADSAVRLTQGSFDASDVSRASTGPAFIRLFTMFFDYFNMLSNLLGTEFTTTMREMGLKKGAGRMMYIYMFGFAGTAIVSELIMKAGGGKLDEDDDDSYLDDLLSIFFGSQFRTLTAMLPGASAVTNYAANKFSEKRVFDDRISLSPAIKMIESTLSAPQSLYEALANDGSKKKAAKDALTAISFLSGVPVAVLAKPIGYQMDVNEGNADPTGPIDYARGLVTGRSSQ